MARGTNRPISHTRSASSLLTLPFVGVPLLGWPMAELRSGLDALVVALLEKEPARRPSSAARVLERLDDIAQPMPADLPIVAEVPAASLLDSIARGRLVGRAEQLAQGTQLWLRALAGQAGLLTNDP